MPFYQSENSTWMEPAVACDEVVFLNTVSENLDDFTVVAAIDMDDVDADDFTTFTVIAGKAADGAVYASRSNIYLVLAEWTYYQSASYTRSVFLKLRLSGPEVAFDTMIWAPGQLLNQYAMSEAGWVVPRGDDVEGGLGLVVRHEQQPLRFRRDR